MSLYTPAHFAVAEPAATERLLRDHPFATLVTPGTPEPFISHLPLLLVPPAVGVMVYAAAIWADAWAIVGALVVSLLLSLLFCGWLMQRLIERQQQEKHDV